MKAERKWVRFPVTPVCSVDTCVTLSRSPSASIRFAGGSGSKLHAVRNVFSIARRLGETDSPPGYIDDGVQFTPEEVRTSEPLLGSNAEYTAAALKHCFIGGDTTQPGPEKEVTEAKLCPCRFGPRFCELFAPYTCPEGSKHSFQQQRGCSWRGLSEENYEGESPLEFEASTRLEPTEPGSFIDWLFDRWGVNAYTFEHRSWSCCGIFGVSAANLLQRPKEVFTLALDEMAGTGKNGEIDVMYYERAWRSLFTVAPQLPAGLAPAMAFKAARRGAAKPPPGGEAPGGGGGNE